MILEERGKNKMSDDYKLSDVSWKCINCKNKWNDYCYNNCTALHNNKVYPSVSNIKYCVPIIKHVVNLFDSIEIAKRILACLILCLYSNDKSLFK